MKYLESLIEPCNCGSKTRHNNGGNYHRIIHLIEHKGRLYMLFTNTRELFPSDNAILVEDEDRLKITFKDSHEVTLSKVCEYLKNDDFLIETTMSDWIKLKEKKLAEGWET